MKKPLKRHAANRRLIGESLEPRCLLAGLIQHGPTAEEFNNVAYFLRTDTPRIERYDIVDRGLVVADYAGRRDGNAGG